MLMTTTQFKSYADKLTRNYLKLLDLFGDPEDPAADSLYKTASDLLDVSVDSGEYDLETDLNAAGRAYLDSYDSSTSTSTAQSQAFGILSALDGHLTNHGSEVDSTVSTVPTYIAYYNGAAGGTSLYDLQVASAFGSLYSSVIDTDIGRYGVWAVSLTPWLTPAAANGMGSRATAGAFTAGTAIDAAEAPALLLVEVTTAFSGGAAAPVVTIAGSDDADVIARYADPDSTTPAGTSTTWSVTLDSNNPASAVSTTITPAVTANARQTVAFGSVSGIVPGSVLKVNAGLIDEEVVVAEAVAGSDVTAAFQKAHAAGAAVTGYRTYATTPSVTGARCQAVSNITFTLSGHAAGAVRVVNRQPRGTV